MKILISGSSGLIGKTLTEFLKSENHSVYKLVRRKPDIEKNEIFWDPDNKTIDLQQIEGFDIVISLSGANIAERRWTSSYKKIIRESRLTTTTFLSDSLQKLANKPGLLLSASAIGIYGDRSGEILTEESSIGTGFLADLGKDWESSAETPGLKRVVKMRFGVVLSKLGGALKKMLPPFKLCLGGRLGDGRQYMSWIHIEDLCRAVLYCIQNENINGPVNFTSPAPLTNSEFTKELALKLKRPAIFPVPYTAARLIFGEMVDSTLFASSRVLPKKLLDAGFNFKFDNLSDALEYELN